VVTSPRRDWDITTITGDLLMGMVLSVPCDLCRARVGVHCRIPEGEGLYEEEGFPFRVHVHRVTPVYMIYKLGYRIGSRDTKERLTKPTE
jgi:hypothetical protein